MYMYIVRWKEINLNLNLNLAWLISITKDRHHLVKIREDGDVDVEKDAAKDYVKAAKSSVSPSVI